MSSLLTELKKNDLYAPYVRRLDRLCKGGDGSGFHGGSAGKASKKANSATQDVDNLPSTASTSTQVGAHAAALQAHKDAAFKQLGAGNVDQAKAHVVRGAKHSKAIKQLLASK